jgi:predicted transcriptional regulator
MTVTIKLDTALEERLRQRAASTGRSTSDVVRAALHEYLADADRALQRSPYELGEGLFGRHQGSVDLASQRKALLAEAWAAKHAGRGA